MFADKLLVVLFLRLDVFEESFSAYVIPTLLTSVFLRMLTTQHSIDMYQQNNGNNSLSLVMVDYLTPHRVIEKCLLTKVYPVTLKSLASFLNN